MADEIVVTVGESSRSTTNIYTDVATLKTDVAALKESLNSQGFPSAVATALHNLVQELAFSTANGTALSNALDTAMGYSSSSSGGSSSSGSTDSGSDTPSTPTTPTLSSISATYTGDGEPVGTSATDIDGIVVKAIYSDGSQEQVINYAISGTVEDGTNIFTVSYSGFTTTVTIQGIEHEYTDVFSDIVTSGSRTFDGGTVSLSINGSNVKISSGTTECNDFIAGDMINISTLALNIDDLKGGNSNVSSVNNQGKIYTLEKGTYKVSITMTKIVNIGRLIFNLRKAGASTNALVSVGHNVASTTSGDVLTSTCTLTEDTDIGSAFLWLFWYSGNNAFDVDIDIKIEKVV